MAGPISNFLNNLFAKRLTTLETPTIETVPQTTNIPVSTHAVMAGATAAMSAPQESGILSGAPMPTDPTLQTLRASGGLTMPQELKQYLPLILVFALFVIILIKK